MKWQAAPKFFHKLVTGFAPRKRSATFPALRSIKPERGVVIPMVPQHWNGRYRAPMQYASRVLESRR
jgi:hypothetical protein